MTAPPPWGPGTPPPGGPYGHPQPHPQHPGGYAPQPPMPQQYLPPQQHLPPPQPMPPQMPQLGPAVQAYIDAVAHRLMADRIQVQQTWIGPVPGLVGVITTNPLISFGSPVEFVLGVAALSEVTPMAVADFPRQVDQFARSQRSLGGLGGAMSVAALVSERVDPAAVQRLSASSQWGSGNIPAVADLGTRQLHIASNTPVFGFAMFGKLRTQANRYLPQPREILG